MKNIISFSLWGSNKKYLIGAIENSILQKKFWPNWTCRFYTHKDVDSDVIRELRKNGAEVIIIEENIAGENPYRTNGIHKGWLWRFKVLEDKEIQRVIVRDVDCRPTFREYNCVKDWIASEKEFHIIRDHVMHSVPICAGMWGTTFEFINRINYQIISAFNESHNANFGGYDQFFLAKQIYPLIKNTACIHDDWDRYKEGARKIPHLRINNEYIGMPIEIQL